jgi:hypothetical protein
LLDRRILSVRHRDHQLPYQRDALAVLAKWRDVDRALAEAAEGSSEAKRLREEAARLRDEYQRLVSEAIAHQRPVPPAFPD